VVVIPPCKNKARRKRLEKDVFKWLRWYGADEFTRDFTEQQREMIRAILVALETGEDQAIAASRGEGKSSVAEWVLMFVLLKGLVTFAVLFAASGPDAENSLDSIKDRLEENERLAEDYPEVCVPIRALEGSPQRAGTQLVTGKRHDNGKTFDGAASNFRWCGKEIRLPRVPGSPASGAIIATRGLDGAVRGLKRGKERPQIAVIDDPDTEDSVANEELALKLEKKIDTTIAGLAGQKRPLARVMLTTIQRRSASAQSSPTRSKSPRGTAGGSSCSKSRRRAAICGKSSSSFSRPIGTTRRPRRTSSTPSTRRRWMPGLSWETLIACRAANARRCSSSTSKWRESAGTPSTRSFRTIRRRKAARSSRVSRPCGSSGK
jgi:hypothetical protein